MKKQSTISKSIWSFLIAFFVFGATTQQVFANPATNPIADKAAEITYKGLQENKLAFNVSYQNELAQKFQLIVKNDQNEVIYLKDFEARPATVRILFSEVPQNCKLTFLIRTGKKEVSKAFEINSQIKTVEEYVVKGI